MPTLPVAFMREHDYYFFQETIEAFLPGNRVMVEGYGEMLLLGGCSYLDLEGHPLLRAAAIEALDRYGTGIQGARLLAGTLAVHHLLEAKIAAFKETEAAITFTSGYAANTSAIPALLGRHDTVIADKLAHASLLDGCQLSRAKLLRFRHNDAGHLDLCGDDEKALRLARGCQKRGLFVQAVISPVVPQGGARLRAVITAGHRPKDLDWSVAVMAEVAAEVGGILPSRQAA